MLGIAPIALFLFAAPLLFSASSDCDSCHMLQYLRTKTFEQRSTRFWEFSEESDTWVEVKLSAGGDCTAVGSIIGEKAAPAPAPAPAMASYPPLGVRKRMSLVKMTDHSIWVSGQSGMIYERFWNGLQWVVARQALPAHAGYGVSVFFVNQKILALSEAGHLYQLQLDSESQPVWVEHTLEFYKVATKETIRLSSGVVANGDERMYFCTKNGLLLEVLEINPPRWAYHGQPHGANVSAIADVDNFRPGLLFIISSSGDLYEYDHTSKPPWKKHIRQQEPTKDNTALASSRACSLHGLVGPHSVSLFLLTKGGELIERRLHQRKWKWVVHGNPNGHVLTSITCISQDEPNDQNSNTLFLTTAAGFIFQYHIRTHPDISQDMDENWLNHNHPPHAWAARGISGIQLQPGRMIFPLDDGRLAELHLSGLGGESLGPNAPLSTRRKPSLKYVWSVLDAPESEGWNSEYCTEQDGPTNCMLGTKGETSEKVSFSRWRKDGKTQQSYLIPSSGPDIGGPPVSRKDYDQVDRFFRLRVMEEGKSFFVITDKGVIFECLKEGNAWFWLKHEHVIGFRGIVGKYNGSLFSIDENGSLLMRERSGSDDLVWMNCTSMRRGKTVIGGSPWDSAPGQKLRARSEDALFFVSESGRLIQFKVALRKFKWKDCKNPPGTKIASIVDQEGFRENIVFVIGDNGRLYQYNQVTGLWHEHYQSQHLVLSRSPGTAMRPSAYSPKGSLFMLSEDGGLVEYQWGPTDGWNWIEHGQAQTNVTFVGAPGPCSGGTELFLIGSDGNVYRRYLDQGEWKWENCGFPYVRPEAVNGNERQAVKGGGGNEIYVGQLIGGFEEIGEKSKGVDRNCNPKVSSTRPIAFSENAVIFELQDGRMAELSRMEDGSWMWSHAVVTPESLCTTNFWASPRGKSKTKMNEGKQRLVMYI